MRQEKKIRRRDCPSLRELPRMEQILQEQTVRRAQLPTGDPVKMKRR